MCPLNGEPLISVKMSKKSGDTMEDLLLLAKRKAPVEEASNQSQKKKKKSKNKGGKAPAAPAVVEPANDYPYPVVPDDHCESPMEAYQDIEHFLIVIAKSLGKTKESLRIFDPYFCEGSMKERLAAIGFPNVTNEKKDFYESIMSDTVPDYDVLITNPPYSGSHMERLLQYCNETNGTRPWFLLLPNYVYAKDYYTAIFERSKTGSKPFYVTPANGRRYLYSTPKGRRQEKSSKYTSPFPTFWYCQIYE